jgi:hypothetical protein
MKTKTLRSTSLVALWLLLLGMIQAAIVEEDRMVVQVDEADTDEFVLTINRKRRVKKIMKSFKTKAPTAKIPVASRRLNRQRRR